MQRSFPPDNRRLSGAVGLLASTGRYIRLPDSPLCDGTRAWVRNRRRRERSVADTHLRMKEAKVKTNHEEVPSRDDGGSQTTEPMRIESGAYLGTGSGSSAWGDRIVAALVGATAYATEQAARKEGGEMPGGRDTGG